MKRFLSVLLSLVMLLALALGASSAAAEAPTTATAWLLYYASPSWWPQHQTMDQPASETGVEAANALITGPGQYTVGLKFNWDAAQGALQFDLILQDAEVAFPGYYVDITDIRVNGVSIPMTADNMYGTYHDDPNSGLAPIYNNYWNAVETPGSTGPDPSTMRAFDGTLDTESHEIIDPSQIVNATNIEVDFIVAAEPGAAPEALGEQPYAVPALEAGPAAAPPADGSASSTTARLIYLDSDYWPSTDGANIESPEVELTGVGHYTATVYLVDQGGWTQSSNCNGTNRLHLVVDSPASTAMEGMYIGVSDIRVDGVSIPFGTPGYGQTYYDDSSFGYFSADDFYLILYDDYQVGAGSTPSSMGMKTWDGSEGTVAAIDPNALNQFTRVELDFFVTATQGMVPATETVEPVWYNSNTVGLAGLSLSDLGLANDWHNIVPVDVSNTGWQVFTLVGADAHIIGHAYVAVNNGSVSVSFDYAGGPTAMLIEHSECIKWFTSLEDITPEALASTEGGYTSADAVSVANDLNGQDVVFLSVNNKITWRAPIDEYGSNLPRYWRNSPEWVSYRETLKTLLPAE